MSEAATSVTDAPNDPSRGPRRRVVGLVTLVAVILGAVVLTVGPPRPGEAFDPRSVSPDGLAGLVELLEAVDVDVEVSRDLPSDLSTRLFIATERLGDDAREAVSSWISSGGTLIVAGPSQLHGWDLLEGSVTDLFGATSRSPRCALDELAQVGEVEHAAWNGLGLPAEQEDVVACFAGGEGDAWLLASTQGRGRVIALGSAMPFVNANLDRADNAVLAAALLAPQPGDGVVIVPPAEVGGGETAVTDLVPDGFWRLLWLSVAAAIVAVVWRSRRLGPPVDERLPPVLPSAELAGSIGALLQRSGDRGTAAMRLRADVRNDALHRLGMPATTDDDQLGALVVARTGATSGAVRLALRGGAVADDAALLELARACHAVRANLRHPEPVTPEGANSR